MSNTPRHVIKYTHNDGKKLDAPEYWCGEIGYDRQWHFLDAHHLALSVGGSVQPCERCVKAVIKALETEL